MKKKAEAAQEKSRLDALAAEKARKEALEAIKVSEAIRAAAEKAEEDLRRTQAEMDQKEKESNLFYEQLVGAFDPTAIQSIWSKATQLGSPGTTRAETRFGRANSR
jgi:hypothetical protein